MAINVSMKDAEEVYSAYGIDNLNLGKCLLPTISFFPRSYSNIFKSITHTSKNANVVQQLLKSSLLCYHRTLP
jgi:hypothetical protein